MTGNSSSHQRQDCCGRILRNVHCAGDRTCNSTDQEDGKRAKEDETDPLPNKGGQHAGKYQRRQRDFKTDVRYAHDQTGCQTGKQFFWLELVKNIFYAHLGLACSQKKQLQTR